MEKSQNVGTESEFTPSFYKKIEKDIKTMNYFFVFS